MKTFNFPIAMMYAFKGFKVARLAWEKYDTYIKIKDGVILYSEPLSDIENGRRDEYPWDAIHEDLLATDWHVWDTNVYPQLEVIEWVPVSERLPPVGNYEPYLCTEIWDTTGGQEVKIGVKDWIGTILLAGDQEQGFCTGNGRPTITAWAELPAPYNAIL